MTGDHLFSTFAKFSDKTNISYPLIRTRTCAYQGVKNVSFSENFANVLNGRSRVKFNSFQVYTFENIRNELWTLASDISIVVKYIIHECTDSSTQKWSFQGRITLVNVNKSLIHFWSMLSFYTRWKHQKTFGFQGFFSVSTGVVSSKKVYKYLDALSFPRKKR